MDKRQEAAIGLDAHDLQTRLEALLALYEKELCLKRTLLLDMGRVSERQQQLVCLSAWLEQPFLTIDGEGHRQAIDAWCEMVQGR